MNISVSDNGDLFVGIVLTNSATYQGLDNYTFFAFKVLMLVKINHTFNSVNNHHQLLIVINFIMIQHPHGDRT